MPPTTKIKIKINATALKGSTCRRAFYWQVITGLKAPVNFNDTEFGSALHIFLRVMAETGGNIAEAVRASRTYFDTTKMFIKTKKQYLDAFHLAKVSLAYWQWLQEHDDAKIILNEENKPAVEVTFSNLVYEDEYIEVYFEGTIDRLTKIVNGCFCIRDYKSTSSADHEEYFRNYETSTQLKFYVLNCYIYAQKHPDSLMAQICQNQIGAAIDGIFLHGKDKTEFESSRVFFFKKADLDLYQKMLMEKVKSLFQFIPENITPPPEGMVDDTCSKADVTGGWRCKFFNICSQPDEIASHHVMNDKTQFITVPYEPLKVHEV